MPDAPVYVMGGSYGGMLAAWARMKYPTHFQGALAASAPILWFTNKTDPNAYTKVASQSIMDVSGKQCGELQARGFYDLQNMVNSASTYKDIKQIFNLCDNNTVNANLIETLIATISDSLGTMAMVNYPYPTNFVAPLPAWPVKAGCDAALQVPADTSNTTYNYTHIKALQAEFNVFNNYSG